MLSFLFVSADVSLNHYQFFRIIGVVIDGLKVKYEILDGFYISWFGLLIWTTVTLMLIRFIVAIIGGE